jgi:hypothetical protein
LYLGPFLSDWGADPSSLDLNNFTLSRQRRGDGANILSDSFRDAWLPAFGGLLRARFYAHAVRRPSRVPFGRYLIMAALPRARFLFLLRDGRDVVDSELAASHSGSWVTKEFPGLQDLPPGNRLSIVTNSAYKWLWRTEVVQEAFAEHPGPKYLVRYEDLLQNPNNELRSLFDWLDLEVSARELDEWIRKQSFDEIPAELRGPDKFFRAAAPGLWRTNLTAEENTTVASIIGDKLRELGYPE